MSALKFILLILAVAVLLAAALEIKAPRVDLVALGLALMALAMLVEAR